MSDNATQRVAVLGTGVMGKGMARSLRRGGHDVVVWNRTRSRAEVLADDGITVAGSVREAVEGADVVVTMLFDTDAVLAIADELIDSLGPDAVWLQSATVGPEGIARIAAKRPTTRLLDAPMLGTKAPAEQGTLVGLLSGPQELIDAAGPALAAMTSRSIIAGGTVGAASGLKLACNAWIGTITAATAQSVALAEGLGVDPALFLSAIEGGAADSAYAQMKGREMLNGSFEPSFSVDGVRKDTALIHDAIAGAGLRTELTDAVQRLFDDASAAGHGGEDLAAVRLSFTGPPQVSPPSSRPS
ncbi:MAG: NAD(P)-dependent oxidoreductase [Allobranchiibius sp.]